jgi:hypothetical protein
MARTVQTSEAMIAVGAGAGFRRRDRLVLDFYRDLARTQIKERTRVPAARGRPGSMVVCMARTSASGLSSRVEF